MAVNTNLSRSAHSKILAHLRTLRASLAHARDALLHYKADRVDRDKLEPAARRVDDLMNMFASNAPDPTQASIWVTEVLDGVDQVNNPKATAALGEARVDITALFDEIGFEDKPLPPPEPAAPPPA